MTIFVPKSRIVQSHLPCDKNYSKSSQASLVLSDTVCRQYRAMKGPVCMTECGARCSSWMFLCLFFVFQSW